MARFELQIKKSVSKDLDPLPKKDVQRIVQAVNGLADNPRPPQSIKLSGEERYRHSVVALIEFSTRFTIRF